MQGKAGLIVTACFGGSIFASSFAACWAQEAPFLGMEGTWSGGGMISLSGGNTERIRCRGNYGVDQYGTRLLQDVRCASDSYRFDFRVEAIAKNDEISGTWIEKDRQLSGTLNGLVLSGYFNMVIGAPTFSANLAAKVKSGRQKIWIGSTNEFPASAHIEMLKGTPTQ
jgi:hypothetical protein